MNIKVIVIVYDMDRVVWFVVISLLKFLLLIILLS